MPKFIVARFHVTTGPRSLFDRVKFIMSKKGELQTHCDHFKERITERQIPELLVKTFDARTWELMDAEVRTDTGKFVSSTWRKQLNGRYLWIVIGFSDQVKTAIWDKVPRPSINIITEGELYTFVDEVNRKLMEAEDGMRAEPSV